MTFEELYIESLVKMPFVFGKKYLRRGKEISDLVTNAIHSIRNNFHGLMSYTKDDKDNINAFLLLHKTDLCDVYVTLQVNPNGYNEITYIEVVDMP